MSKFRVPPEIIIQQEKYTSEIKRISLSTLIFDRNVYLSCIREIIYFYKRKLLSKEEVSLLRQELLKSVTTMEKIATEGRTKEGTIVKLYMSSVDVGASYTYFEADNNTICQFPVFTIYSLESQDSKLGSVQKEWIESFKKYSTCISEASEIERFEYCAEQRELINTLTDIL